MAAIGIADASPLIDLARVLVADAVLHKVLTGGFRVTDKRIQAGLTGSVVDR